MKIAYILIGPPGCGKSTMVQKAMGKYSDNTFVYSTDDYIETIAKLNRSTYDEMFASTIKEATQMCDEALQQAIEDGLDIVWDQTNLGLKKRKSIIDKLKPHNYFINAVAVRMPELGHFDAWKEYDHRLKMREGKTIPTHIIQNMLKSYVEPTVEEGFDRVEFYSMWGVKIE